MEPHDEKACRRIREQLVSTAENLSVTNCGIAAAIRDLEWLRKETKDPDTAKAFDVAISVIQAKIHDPSAETTYAQEPRRVSSPGDSEKKRSRGNSPHPEQVTPEQARKLLEGTTPTPWEVESWDQQKVDCPEVTNFWVTGADDRQVAEQETLNRNLDETEQNFALIAAAPAMAGMIADMHIEHRHEVRIGDVWLQLTPWGGGKPDPCPVVSSPTRIVYRYVTKPHPVEEMHK